MQLCRTKKKVTHPPLFVTSTNANPLMQIELSPPPTKEKDKDEKWWGTEEVRASWMEFLETNKVRSDHARPPRIWAR